MGWADDVGPEELDEADNGGAGAGDYMAAGVALNPRESIHFHFTRTDTPTEAWAIEIYASTDNATWGEVPIASRRWEAAAAEGDIVITGPRYVIARAVNADPGPVDVVVVDVTYSKDQVSI